MCADAAFRTLASTSHLYGYHMNLDMDDLSAKLQERIDQNSAPSLSEPIDSGEIIKHSRDYEVRSERESKAIVPHLKSIIPPSDKSKPILVTLYRKTINKCSIKSSEWISGCKMFFGRP